MAPRYVRFFCRAANKTGSCGHDPAGVEQAARVGHRPTFWLQLSTRAATQPPPLWDGMGVVDPGTTTAQLVGAGTVTAAAAEAEAPTGVLPDYRREGGLLGPEVIVHVSWNSVPGEIRALLASSQESPPRQTGSVIRGQIPNVLPSGDPKPACEETVRSARSDLTAWPSGGMWILAPTSQERGWWARPSALHALRDYSAAVQLNGLGRYQDALDAAQRACDHGDRTLIAWALVELIEAARRSDRPEAARAALERLDECTPASGNDWNIGLVARSKALLAEGEEAEALFREAIDGLDRTRIVDHLGRAHLVYGEWLRRANRRIDAREQLRRAYQILSEVGATAFAARAQSELLATCETVRKRSVETFDQLTAQETQIACLARTATQIRRSPPASSSAHARSSGTFARSSPSSGSAHAGPSATPCPLGDQDVVSASRQVI